MDAKSIIERADKAAAERKRFEPIFDEAIRLTMPGRPRFFDNDPAAAMDDIFDETGANALEEFVSRMQAGLFPPFTSFLEMEASSAVDAKDRQAVNRDLAEICEFAFEEIWSSNFAQESSETLNDVAMSTGMLLVEEGRGDLALSHRAVPITEQLIERGPNDTIGGVFRVTKELPAAMIEARYGRHLKADMRGKTASAMKREGDKKLEVIEYTVRDWSSIYEERYQHFVVVKDFKEIIVQRTMKGAGSSPFITYRWGTGGGQTWSRGPLMNAMAAIRTTNLMVEMVLENAAMSIVGMYQTDNDGIVNAGNISLLPGTIIPKEFGTSGLEPIQGPAGNFNMRDVVLSDQRLNIRKALYNDMLSDPNKTPASATEVAERMADLAYRTSSGFARVFYEFLVPYMRRVLFILEKRGDIQLPVKNGRALSFRAVSPLARAQYGREMQSLMQDFQFRSMMHGPQVAMGSYKFKETHEWLQKRTGVDDRLYESADTIQKAMAENQKAIAEQMQAEQQGQTGPMGAAP